MLFLCHVVWQVTGFGLGGHAIEMARASDKVLCIDWASVPLISGVRWVICFMEGKSFLEYIKFILRVGNYNLFAFGRELAAAGCVTGASNRNWESYGHQILLTGTPGPDDVKILTDPQTSGGLLVACESYIDRTA